MTNQRTERYASIQIAIHWLIAILVVAAYCTMLYRKTVPRGDYRTFVLSVHMWFGMSVLLLTMARFYIRAKLPQLPAVGTSFQQKAAKYGHWLLLLLTVIIPVGGLVAAWLKQRGVSFFGLFPLPSPFPPSKDLAGTMEKAHEFLGDMLMILACGHAVLAIVHQYVVRDGILARMLPILGRRSA